MKNDLIGSKCKCGTISLPPMEHCSLCDSKPVELHIDTRGKVLSFTILHVTAKGFDAPQGIAMVELENGMRAMCNYEPDSKLQIGDEVGLVLVEDRLNIVN